MLSFVFLRKPSRCFSVFVYFLANGKYIIHDRFLMFVYKFILSRCFPFWFLTKNNVFQENSTFGWK